MVSTAINQHLVLPNIFINASCALTKVDARFVTSLLVRIRRRGLEFEELRVPLREVLTPGTRKLSSKDYNTGLVALQARLTSINLQLEPAFPAAGQHKEAGLPLLAYVRYEKQKGWLRVRLADALRPYFEQSNVAYTSAPYAEITKLVSPLAHRLYWLLRECAAAGTRRLELAQLAWMLSLPSNGFNLSLFCMRELIAAQKQLAVTDLPCTFELEYTRQKSRLYAVHFRFTPLESMRAPGVLLSTESKPGGASWFESEEENLLFSGLLILLRVIASGACVAAMATYGVG